MKIIFILDLNNTYGTYIDFYIQKDFNKILEFELIIKVILRGLIQMAKIRAVQFCKTNGLLALLLFIGIGKASAAELTVFDQGATGSSWGRGISAFDAAIGYGVCSNDGGASCPSISWSTVNDSQRGNVLQVNHSWLSMVFSINVQTLPCQ